jgi:hypothetical protein
MTLIKCAVVFTRPHRLLKLLHHLWLRGDGGILLDADKGLALVVRSALVGRRVAVGVERGQVGPRLEGILHLFEVSIDLAAS